jgi:cytochrome c oxidase subunit 1
VTATAAQPTAVPARKPLGESLARILTTTDHKLIGKL